MVGTAMASLEVMRRQYFELCEHTDVVRNVEETLYLGKGFTITTPDGISFGVAEGLEKGLQRDMARAIADYRKCLVKSIARSSSCIRSAEQFVKEQGNVKS